MESLLAVVRGPDELVALISRRRAGCTRDVETLRREPPATFELDLFEVAEMPLEQAACVPSARRDALLAAWHALAQVKRWDADTLFHVLAVLLETVQGESRPGPLPPLPTPADERRSRPTAAHPRAYRGTTYRPPKPADAPITDLRPYLLSRGHQQQVFIRLRSHWPEALTRLQHAGYRVDRLAVLPELALATCDPYVAVHHREAIPPTEIDLPAAFRLTLWPPLRGYTWTEVRAFLGVFWEMALDRHTALAAAVARVLSLSGKNALDWCRLMLRLPEDRRLLFATMLLETGAYRLDAGCLTAEEMEEFGALATPMHEAYWLWCLFTALMGGLSARYMLDGFRLARTYGVERSYSLASLQDVATGASSPLPAIERFTEHVREAEQWCPDHPVMLWKRCGELTGFGVIIERTAWTTFTPEVAYKYMDLYGGQVFQDVPPDLLNRKWRFLCERASVWERLLARTDSDYQEKVIDHLDEFFWQWDSVPDLERFLPPAIAMIERVARPSYRRESSGAVVLAHLIESLPASHRDHLLEAPDASLRALERACHLRNNAVLIAAGVKALSRRLSALAVTCFIEAPRRLFAAAKLLGSLQPPVREQVVRDLIAPLSELGELAEYVDESQPSTGTDAAPLPVLGAAEYGSHRKSLSLALTLLEDAVHRALACDFPIEPGRADATHALQLSGTIDDNRRALRKFLRAHFRDQPDYILLHPRTREWLRRHPALDIDLWRVGIAYTGMSAAHGEVRLAVEQDPLEALKLGTYVGSCLGLGGSFAYSAVAAVLDINKRVVYARGTNGKVIARQLLAIAEDDRLVCFDVYPRSAERELRAMFRAYNLAFASTLGLKLHRPGDDDSYEIATILAQSWWDDHAWDGKPAA